MCNGWCFRSVCVCVCVCIYVCVCVCELQYVSTHNKTQIIVDFRRSNKINYKYILQMVYLTQVEVIHRFRGHCMSDANTTYLGSFGMYHGILHKSLTKLYIFFNSTF